MKERLKRWGQGHYRQLWDEAVEMTRPPPKARQKRRKTGQPEAGEKTQEERNAERATELAHQGQYTRSLQALNSAGLAKHTPATVAEMEAKHPLPEHPTSFQHTSDHPQLSFSQLEVWKAVKSFRKGSAPGP